MYTTLRVYPARRTLAPGPTQDRLGKPLRQSAGGTSTLGHGMAPASSRSQKIVARTRAKKPRMIVRFSLPRCHVASFVMSFAQKFFIYPKTSPLSPFSTPRAPGPGPSPQEARREGHAQHTMKLRKTLRALKSRTAGRAAELHAECAHIYPHISTPPARDHTPVARRPT